MRNTDIWLDLNGQKSILKKKKIITFGNFSRTGPVVRIYLCNIENIESDKERAEQQEWSRFY